MAERTITVSREQMELAAATFDAIQRGRGNPKAAAESLGQGFSFTGRRDRQYLTPKAAHAFAAEFGEEEARRYLGGKVLRELSHLFSGGVQVFNQPTATDVHIDVALTNLSIRYRNVDYIGALAVPRVQVVKRSDKFFKFDLANLRNDALNRAPGDPYRRTGYNLTTGNYSVEDYGLEHPVPIEVRENADSPLSPDRNGVEFVSDQIDLKYEIGAQTLLFTSSNWTTNVTLSGTSKWSDPVNSDPFGDLKTARLTIRKQIARPANTLVLGYEVFEGLALHPDLLDRVKYTGTGDRPAMVTAQMMAALFMFDQVLVGGSVYNTANEGQSDSLDFIWGKKAWVGYLPTGPAIDTPAAAYAFTTGRQASTYWENQTKSDIIQLDEAWDMRATAAGAGYLITNAVA